MLTLFPFLLLAYFFIRAGCKPTAEPSSITLGWDSRTGTDCTKTTWGRVCYYRVI